MTNTTTTKTRTMAETPTDIGTRIGRAIARAVLAEHRPRAWTGLDAHGDHLLAAGIDADTPAWAEAERAARGAYEHVLILQYASEAVLTVDDAGVWSGEVHTLPGCVSQGATYADVRAMLDDAIREILAAHRDAEELS